MSGTPFLKPTLLKPAATLAALLLATLALAACGATEVSTSGYKGEARAVAARVSAFQGDATASDQKKVCENDLAASVRASLRSAGGDCESALKSQLSQIDTLELKIRSIEVKGRAAKAHVQSTWSGKTRESTLALVKEGGAWRISRLL
jgi:hypothetical protein